jgi:hypothetical protein
LPLQQLHNSFRIAIYSLDLSRKASLEQASCLFHKKYGRGLLDIDNDLQVKNTYLILPENLPEIYLPETDSYYELSDLNRETAEEDRLLIYQKISCESQLSKV